MSQAAKSSLAVTAMVPERTVGMIFSGVVRSIRPPEWIKNILVFAAAVFSGNFFVRQPFLNSLMAFGALCLVASATYLLNDVKDREADRYHPSKRSRPIASGMVPPTTALMVASVMGILGIALGFSINILTGSGVLGYLLLTTVYSLLLKHMVILDVLALSSAFVLRVVVGAEAAGVEFNLYLIDGATFPFLPAKNITFSLMANAVRVAETAF